MISAPEAKEGVIRTGNGTATWFWPQLLSLRAKSLGGRAPQPQWERPTLLTILTFNILINFWNLGINGWGNHFYAAAVQAGTKNLTSAFFGASDWGNSITVDKPPLSLWVMELSARTFGFSPISVLAPQALMGVASTLIIYVIVRREFPALAALIAALIFCTTPIVVLMSRYNNPDPLMVLLMLVAFYVMQLAISSGRGKTFVSVALLLGLAFMAKQLQSLMILPSLGVAYLIWFHSQWRKKTVQILVAFGSLAITGGLWMFVVDHIPTQVRPYVGGSASNSFLELTLAYNGLNRVLQNADVASVGLVPEQFRRVESDAGPVRLLNSNYGQEIGWLLMAGIICTLLIIVLWRLLPASKGAKATAFMATSWFLVTLIVLSFMGDQIHTYHTEALAPPLSLVIGIVIGMYIRVGRKSAALRAGSAAAVLTTAVISWLLLNSVVGWPEWLPTAVLAVGGVGAAMLSLVAPNRGLLVFASLAALASLLTGPVLTSLHNVTIPHNGSNPVSGLLTKNTGSISRFLDEMEDGQHASSAHVVFGKSPVPGIVDMLRTSSGCTWAAATYPSQSAARLQLESDRAVMPIGGFAGTDPSPSLQEFARNVDEGRICYLVTDDDLVRNATESNAATDITQWVKTRFPVESVGGQAVYVLRPGD